MHKSRHRYCGCQDGAFSPPVAGHKHLSHSSHYWCQDSVLSLPVAGHVRAAAATNYWCQNGDSPSWLLGATVGWRGERNMLLFPPRLGSYPVCLRAAGQTQRQHTPPGSPSGYMAVAKTAAVCSRLPFQSWCFLQLLAAGTVGYVCTGYFTSTSSTLIHDVPLFSNEFPLQISLQLSPGNAFPLLLCYYFPLA